MPRYSVHLYPTMRVKFSGIEASSRAAAVSQAIELLFDRCQPLIDVRHPADRTISEVELAGELHLGDGFMVDRIGKSGGRVESWDGKATLDDRGKIEKIEWRRQ